MKRLLVATDLRAGSSAATRWAGGLAQDLGLAVILLHVVQPVEVPQQWRRYVSDIDEEQVARAQRALATGAASVRDVATDRPW